MVQESPGENKAMILCYVSGSLGGRKVSDIVQERRDIVRPLRQAGWEVYDPFENERAQRGVLVPNDLSLSTLKKYVSKDDRQVRKADVLIVTTGDQASDGTWDEKCTAWHQGSIVILIAPLRKASKLVGFANVKAHYLASSSRDAVRWALRHVAESSDGRLHVK